MTLRWASVLAVLMAGLPAAVRAQQSMAEAGIEVIATAADPGFAGAGLYAALRPAGRLRFSAVLADGIRGEERAGRGELVAHFLLSPWSRRGGWYGGGGVAAVAARQTRGYALLVVGYETSPAGRTGWAFELGLGGGLRLGAGYRWRRSW